MSSETTDKRHTVAACRLSVGIDGKQISTYTQKLERLRLVEREVLVTEDKTKSRRGRHRILDPLFRF